MVAATLITKVAVGVAQVTVTTNAMKGFQDGLAWCCWLIAVRKPGRIPDILKHALVIQSNYGHLALWRNLVVLALTWLQ